jgi:predicted nucleic-acid-binding protein
VIGLDTSVLLRWLIDDSIAEDDAPSQTALVEAAILDAGEVCYVNAVVTAETLWVVGKTLKQPRGVQTEIVERLLHSRNVEVGDRRAVMAALEGFRSGGSGGFVDHMIGALNRAAGCSTTLTFDEAASKSPDFIQLA